MSVYFRILQNFRCLSMKSMPMRCITFEKIYMEASSSEEGSDNEAADNAEKYAMTYLKRHYHH